MIPIFKNIRGGVAGVTVCVYVLQGPEVADGEGEPAVVCPDDGYLRQERTVEKEGLVLTPKLCHDWLT